MHFVANEPLGLVHQVHALPKTVLEVDLIAFGDGDSIGDADHERSILCFSPGAVAG
jgi:hypothetical protein